MREDLATAGKPSHVLKAIGKGDVTSKVLRVSISEDTSNDDIKAFISSLLKL